MNDWFKYLTGKLLPACSQQPVLTDPLPPTPELVSVIERALLARKLLGHRGMQS